MGNVIMEIIKWGFRLEKNMPGTSPELLFLLKMFFLVQVLAVLAR